jgi:hypothetical protein
MNCPQCTSTNITTEMVTQYIGDSAGVREVYREALLLLAAEL